MSDPHTPANQTELRKETETAASSEQTASPSERPGTPHPPPEPPAAPSPAPRRASPAVGWLAALLGVVIAEVLSAPFWAPALTPLLPWGTAPQHDDSQVKALSTRLDRLESPPGRLEKVEGLSQRVDRLDAARSQEQQSGAATTATLQQIDRRLTALETRPATPVGDIAELRQQSSKLGGTVADLTTRVDTLASRIDTLEKMVKAQAASDATDTALTLLVLQIREAVDVARPFVAEYDSFTALARNRPDIAAAAAPLATAAKSGLPSRAVLIRRLGDLAGTIATAEPNAADAGWEDQALARLRSLVTIRRISGGGQTAPENAVNAAQQLLAQGDLAGAIGALDKLGGANAEAARPWLEMARARLAVETALQKTEALLTARLAAARSGNEGAGRP